jgi:hypothetical protein
VPVHRRLLLGRGRIFSGDHGVRRRLFAYSTMLVLAIADRVSEPRATKDG